MPQMSPMNWLFLLIYFQFIYFILLVFIYFNFLFKMFFFSESSVKKYFYKVMWY